MRLALIITLMLIAGCAQAGSLQTGDTALILGSNAQWQPSQACGPAPVARDNPDYQAQNQTYMACVKSEAEADMAATQKSINESIRNIQNGQDEQQNELFVLQKETRSLANHLNGAGH